MWLTINRLITPIIRNTCINNQFGQKSNGLKLVIPTLTTIRDYHLFTQKPQCLLNNGYFTGHTNSNTDYNNYQQSSPSIFQQLKKILYLPQLQQSCGFKVKGRLRRRCKDCFFVIRHARMYVICKTHPRHKQMSLKRKEKNTWILTHAIQSKVRPY